MNEQLVGHDDGVTESGVRRLRRPPDWEQGIRSGAVTTIAWLLPDVTPAIGDDCDIDGMRYRVLDSTWLAKTPHPGMLVDDRGRAIQLELDPIGESYPAEFHGQTALEAAIALHRQVRQRLGQIDLIEIETQEAGQRIIDKRGELANPADRDHCIQYMVAVGLIWGTLTSDHYEVTTAADPRVDALRDRTVVRERSAFTRDYFDPAKRSIANSVQVTFTDGSRIQPVVVECPLGHPRRRAEALPVVRQKFQTNLSAHLPPRTVNRITSAFDDESILDASIDDVLALFVSEQ